MVSTSGARAYSSYPVVNDILAAAGNATKAAAGGAAKTKKKKKIDYVKTRTGYWHWYIIAGIVGALAAWYIFSLLHNYIQKKRRISQMKRNGAATKSSPSATTRFTRATCAVSNNFLYIRSFPVRLYADTNVTEVFFTIAYLGVCLGLTLYKTKRKFTIIVFASDPR